MPLSASALALALSAALTPASAYQKPAPVPVAQVQTVKQQVQKYFADIPIMIKIAGCESHFRQFDNDGAAYRGQINHSDTGVMQINQYYHLDQATEMGLDLTTIEGNMAYARYLYNEQGTAPWSSSQYCWDPSSAALARADK